MINRYKVLHQKFKPQNEFQSLLKLNTFDLSIVNFVFIIINYDCKKMIISKCFGFVFGNISVFQTPLGWYSKQLLFMWEIITMLLESRKSYKIHSLGTVGTLWRQFTILLLSGPEALLLMIELSHLVPYGHLWPVANKYFATDFKYNIFGILILLIFEFIFQS